MKTFGQTLFLSSAFWLVLVLLQPCASLFKRALVDHPWLGVFFLIPDPPYRLEPLLDWWPVFLGLIGMLLGSAIEAVASVKAGREIK